MNEMKYYATPLHNCLLAQGSPCRKMSNAQSSLMEVAGGGRERKREIEEEKERKRESERE